MEGEVMAVVYAHFDYKGNLFYIGYASECERPFNIHSRSKKWQECANNGITAYILAKDNYKEAAELEYRLIQELKPIANSVKAAKANRVSETKKSVLGLKVGYKLKIDGYTIRHAYAKRIYNKKTYTLYKRVKPCNETISEPLLILNP